MSCEGTQQRLDDRPLVAVVLDGASSDPERDARALAGFLRDGLAAPGAQYVTVVFFTSEAELDRLVALTPTEDVRPVRVPPRRPDLRNAALSALAAEGGADLFVFPSGPSGIEQASRLAARAGGSVATAVREAVAGREGVVCRRHAYSGHLAARLLLHVRPWCLVADARWEDARAGSPAAHRVQSSLEAPDDSLESPLTDVEVLEEAAAADLETARFLVVAGRGAGREGVARIAAAAARMGAAFGVTRPVAMNGWAPMDRLVGVSGARTAPAVCLTAGVQGAPALLWGIERAGFIAGVDLDEHAAIATEGDAVVLDDAVSVVEALADLIDAGDRRT